MVELLNRLLVDALSNVGEDTGKIRFAQTLLSRYISRGRPLSGYFTVCCVMEAQWTVLAQALGPSDLNCVSTGGEAEAANVAWQRLSRHGVSESLTISSDIKDVLRLTMKSGVKTFATLLTQIQEMDAEPSDDSYAWETMSESLVRADV